MVHSSTLHDHANFTIAERSGTLEAGRNASNFFLSANKADIANYAQEGNDLAIEFIDGQKLLIKNFFARGASFHNLIFSEGEDIFLVDFSQALTSDIARSYDGIDEADVIYSKIEDGDEGSNATLILLGLLAAAGAGVAALTGPSSSGKNGADSAPAPEPTPEPTPDPDSEPKKTVKTPSRPVAIDDVGDIRGEIAPGSVTDDRQPDFSGAANPGTKIIVRDNGEIIAEISVDDTGSWHWTPDTPLDEGKHKVTVTERDGDGNESAPSNSLDFEVDTTPPAATATIVSISEDSGLAGDFITSDQTLIIAGQIKGDLATDERVQIRIDNGTWQDVVVSKGSSGWSYDNQANKLGEGSHRIETRTIDKAGNIRDGESKTIIIDTTGNTHAVVEIVSYTDDVAPKEGDFGSGSSTNDRQPLLKGTVSGLEAGDMIEIRLGDGTLLGLATVTGDTWQYQIPHDLVDGRHDFRAVVVDVAGNDGARSPDFTIHVDTVAPNAMNSDLLDLWDDFGLVTGTIVAGSTTDDRTPTYSGLKGSVDFADVKQINIYDKGKYIGTADVKADGSWDFEPNPPLSAGKHEFTARPVDAAGNEGAPTPAWDFNVIGAAPASPAINKVHDNQEPQQGDLQKFDVTNDTTPVVSGTGEVGVRVDIYVEAPDGSVFKAGSTIVGADGHWHLELTEHPLGGVLGDGIYKLRAQAVDDAGQQSEMSGDYEIELDTTPPSQPSLPILQDNIGDDKGNVASGSVIDDNRPTISGNAGVREAGGTARIHVDGVAQDAPVVIAADGSWQFSPSTPLGDGKHVITVTIIDKAGNESKASPAFDVTVDTSGIMISFDHFVDDVGSIIGNVTSGGITDDNLPQMVGKSSPLAQVTVTYVDAQGQIITVGVVRADAQGNWSLTPDTALPDGEYIFTATAVNLASVKNETNFRVTIDTKAPALELSEVEDDVGLIQGAISPDGVTDDATPTFYGKSEVGSIIRIYDDKGTIVGQTTVTASDGSWNITIDQLGADGLHRLRITATDKAGNVSDDISHNIRLDTTAPEAMAKIVSISDDTGVAGDFITSDQTLVIHGTVSVALAADERIQIRIDNGHWLEISAYDPATGRWSYDHSHITLAEGKHSVETRAIDAAGNVAQGDIAKIEIDTSSPTALSTITSITEDTGTSDSDFITSDNTLIIHGTLDRALSAGEKVQVRIDGGTWVDAKATGTSWSYDHTSTALADGSYLVETRTINRVGNVQAGNQQRMTIDTQGPDATSQAAVTFQGFVDDVGSIQGTNIVSGSHTDDTKPLLFGTVTLDAPGDYVVVMMRDASSPTNKWVSLGKAELSGSSWSLEITSALKDGTYAFKAVVYDKAGNRGIESNGFDIIVDTIPPAAIDETRLNLHDDVAPKIGTIARGDDTDDTTPTYSGAPGSVNPKQVKHINIYDKGQKIGEAEVKADGSWVFEPNPPLSAGKHGLTARPVDAAGNEGAPTSEWDFNIIGELPAAPSLDRVYDNFGPIIVPVQQNGVTNDKTPTLSGQATAGNIVHIWVTRPDGKMFDAGQVKVGTNGKWSIELTELGGGDGSYIFHAQAEDSAGQQSPMSGDYPIVLDTTPPEKPSLPILTDHVGDKTGAVISGSTIDDNRPVISGKADVGEAGGYVTIYVDGKQIGQPVVIGQDGTWSIMPTVPWGDGQHKITTRITDVAGNVSEVSDGFDVTIDTSHVVVSVTGFHDNAGTIQGPVTVMGRDGILRTDDTTPQMQGTALANSVVTVTYINARGEKVNFGSTRADTQGNWSIAPSSPLGEGTYHFTVEAMSPAGNKNTANAHLTIDTTPPALTIGQVLDNQGEVHGAIADGDVSDDATPTFSGTAEAGSWIRIYNAAGKIIGETMADASGNWSMTIEALPHDGAHHLRVTATDDVGNESNPLSHTVILDTTAPTTTATVTHITEDTGTPGDFITSDPTLTIGGRVSAKLSTDERIQIRLESGDWVDVTNYNPTTGTWSYDAPHLQDGTYVIDTRVVDKAGNASPIHSQPIVIDTTAPQGASVTIDGYFDDQGNLTGYITDNPSSSDDTMPELRGSIVGLDIQAGDRVMIAVTDSSGKTHLLGPAKLTTDGTGWYYQIDAANALKNGETYKFHAVVQDVAGNLGNKSTDLVITIDQDAPTNHAHLSAISDDTGVVGDFVTSDNTLIYHFTPDTPLQAGETVWMRIKLVEDGRVLMDWRQATFKNGTWQIDDTDMPRLDGVYEIETHVRDGAGNAGASTSKVVTVDTHAPTNEATITAISEDTGIDGDFITTDDTLYITITPTSPLTADEHIEISLDNGASWHWVSYDGAAREYYFDNRGVSLSHGNHIFKTRVVDKAGNIGREISQDIVIDTKSPQTTVQITHFSDDYGPNKFLALPSGSYTDDKTPTLHGILSAQLEASQHVAIYRGSKLVGYANVYGTSWEFTDRGLQDGTTYTYRAVVQNASGLNGSRSSDFEITIDENDNNMAPIIGQNGAYETYSAATRLGANGGWVVMTDMGEFSADGRDFRIFQEPKHLRWDDAKWSNIGGNNKQEKLFSSYSYGDYNHDGYMDVIVTDRSYNGMTATMFVGKADGSYEATLIKSSSLISFGGAVSLDFDGDGWLDFVISDSNYDSAFLAHNKGEKGNGDMTNGQWDRYGKGGAHEKTASQLKNVVIEHELSVVDLDNNGTVDLAFHGKLRHGDARGDLATLYNNGKVSSDGSNWQLGQTFEHAFGWRGEQRSYDKTVSMTWADFNGDGFMDLFVGQSGYNGKFYSESMIYYNDGKGKLKAGQVIEDGVWGKSTLAVDWDGDGHMDIIEVPEVVDSIGQSLFYRNTGKLDAQGQVIWDIQNIKTIGVASKGGNILSNAMLDRQKGATSAALVDYDWDGDRDLVISIDDTHQHSVVVTNANRPEYGTSLHLRIVNPDGSNTLYGNTVQLYDSAGNLVGSQILNPQSGTGWNDSSALVYFNGLNAHETYHAVLLRNVKGASSDVGGVAQVGGNMIENVNASWGDLKATNSWDNHVLTAESGKNVNSSPHPNGVVGTGYNDTFYAQAGVRAYNGGGGWKISDGERKWDVNGGLDIIDFKLAGNQGVRVDLSLTSQQNTGFNKVTLKNIEGVYGTSGNDIFTDSAADNVFEGRGGNDTFNLIHSGHDTLLYRVIDNKDATGGNGHDVVNGFTVADYSGTNANADRIDLSSLLIGYHSDANGAAHWVNGKAQIDFGDNIADYLHVKYDGKNSTLYVDRDGKGGEFHSTALITLNNIEVGLAELLANHQIIVS